MASFHWCYGWVVFHATCRIFFTQSPTAGHWGCFHISATVNDVAMNTERTYFFELVFLFSSDKHPEVELLDHRAVLFLVFWGTSTLFSTVAAPIYIPTNSARGFPFLHILSDTCLFSFWWKPFWQAWGHLAVVLICVSSMISWATPHLLVLCMSSLERCLFWSSVHV